MLKFKTKHFLTGEELMRGELLALLDEAEALKKERPKHSAPGAADKTLVMLFEKPSLRTRISFTVAMQELGMNVAEASERTGVPADVAQRIDQRVRSVAWKHVVPHAL